MKAIYTARRRPPGLASKDHDTTWQSPSVIDVWRRAWGEFITSGL